MLGALAIWALVPIAAVLLAALTIIPACVGKKCARVLFPRSHDLGECPECGNGRVLINRTGVARRLYWLLPLFYFPVFWLVAVARGFYSADAVVLYFVISIFVMVIGGGTLRSMLGGLTYHCAACRHDFFHKGDGDLEAGSQWSGPKWPKWL